MSNENTTRITRPTHKARIRLHERNPEKALGLRRRIEHKGQIRSEV